jgi:hypothetical protein
MTGTKDGLPTDITNYFYNTVSTIRIVYKILYNSAINQHVYNFS